MMATLLQSVAVRNQLTSGPSDVNLMIRFDGTALCALDHIAASNLE
jgi:hypothetical protein